MAGLQRSAVSFRRQGSSGLVWDDKFLSDELNHHQFSQNQDTNIMDSESSSSAAADRQGQGQGQGQEVKEDDKAARTFGPTSTIERSRSTGSGGRNYRTGKVSPAIEPPSPKVSACGFCSAFGGKQDKMTRSRRPKSGKRRT